MIVIFVPCINKSTTVKRLVSLCSLSVDDFSNSVFGIFFAHHPDFMKEMEWLKKDDTEDLVKGLGEFTQKLDVVAAIIITLIDVKGESESKQQPPCYFCYDHFLNSGWSFCADITSFLSTIVECYHMECSLSPMRSVYYMIPITEIYFWTSLSNGFEVIYENPSQAPEYLQPHVSYILSNMNSSSTQLMILSDWWKITNYVLPYITSSVECFSNFLNTWMKHLEERKPFDLTSSLNVRCCKLWFESFGNIFCNASALKHKKRKCISSLQRCHDPSCPFNNCKDVKAHLSAFKDEFRYLFFMDVHEILQSAFECIGADSYFKAAIKKSPLLEVALLVSMRI